MCHSRGALEDPGHICIQFILAVSVSVVSALELETKVIRGFLKTSQSQRRPLLGHNAIIIMDTGQVAIRHYANQVPSL